MNTIKMLFAAAAASVLTFSAFAAGKTAKAVLESDGQQLRFVYDDKDYGVKDTSWFSVAEAEAIVNPLLQATPWYDVRDAVTNAIVDASFTAYRPTQCVSWFDGFTNLTTITELTNLDTSRAVSMRNMFRDCEKLETLDLSSFNTANVTNMKEMVKNCTSLTTIYASELFVVDQVSDSAQMFTKCSNLVGGAGTKYSVSTGVNKFRAHVDGGTSSPGYFTEKEFDFAARVVVADGGQTLRFVCDAANHGVKGAQWFSVAEAEADEDYHHLPPWACMAETVTKVVFDESFASYRPKHCAKWFSGFTHLESVEDVRYLDASKSTSFWGMFEDCKALVTLDLRGLDTTSAVEFEFMFDRCSALKTIYVSDTFEIRFVSTYDNHWFGMFEDCTSLVGGNGTVYDADLFDSSGGCDSHYACIDSPCQRGFFTGEKPIVDWPVGRYRSLNLADDFGVRVNADFAAGDKATVKIEGLAKGLKLTAVPVYEDPKAKKKVIVDYDFVISGVPMAAVDALVTPMYVCITVTYKDKTKGVNGKSESKRELPLSITPAVARELTAGVLGQAYGPEDIATLWPAVADVKTHPKEWSFKSWPKGLSLKNNELSGVPTQAGSFTIVATHKHKLSDGKTTVSETETATLVVWSQGSETDFRYTDRARTEVNRKLADDVRSAVNLPTGLKFAVGSVVGTPTKPGVYPVTLKKADGSTESFLWRITEAVGVGVADSIPWPHSYAQFANGVVSLTQGVYYWAYEWVVPVPEGAKFSVSGLPTGLKLVDWGDGVVRIGGTPTKVGRTTAVFKTVLNGVTVTETLLFEVRPNPIAGTYYLVQELGCTHPYTRATLSATLTVQPSGVAKLVLIENGRKTTVTGAQGEMGVGFNLSLNPDQEYEDYITSRRITVSWFEEANGEFSGCCKECWRLSDGYDDGRFVGVFRKAAVPEEMTEDQVVTGVYAYEVVPGEEQVAYLTGTINHKTGAVAVTGKLSDGTAIKATTYLLDDEGLDDEWVPLFAPVVVTDKAKRTIAFQLFGDEVGVPLVRVDGTGRVVESRHGWYAASDLKNIQASDVVPAANGLAINYIGITGNFVWEPTAKQLATKLGANGLLKLSAKDDYNNTWSFELVPVVYNNADVFIGLATGKQSGVPLFASAELAVME